MLKYLVTVLCNVVRNSQNIKTGFGILKIFANENVFILLVNVILSALLKNQYGALYNISLTLSEICSTA